MKVLVTGGAGYIGSHVAQRLRESGHEVIIYDNLSNGQAAAALGGELVIADLKDETTLADTFDRYAIDAVMNFAGSIYTDESIVKPLDYYGNNLGGLTALLRQCRRCEVSYFVFSSTAAIYAPTDEPTAETDALRPMSPYGWSKMMCEQILLDEQNARDINCAILRYYNAAGADPQARLGNSGLARHLVKVSVQAALGLIDGLTVYGTDYATRDGTCVRDYIHVSDLAQIHVDALAFISSRNQSLLLNCGYGHGYSVREIIDVVKRVSGEDFPVKEGERRSGDSPFLVAGNQRLRSTLNWTPAYDDIEAIVRHALTWEKKLQASSGRVFRELSA